MASQPRVMEIEQQGIERFQIEIEQVHQKIYSELPLVEQIPSQQLF